MDNLIPTDLANYAVRLMLNVPEVFRGKLSVSVFVVVAAVFIGVVVIIDVIVCCCCYWC